MMKKPTFFTNSIQNLVNSSLDAYDLHILNLLEKEDSRKSLTEISRQVGLSRFAVKTRVEKMFRDGFILGPTIVVNPHVIGFGRTLFFEVKTNPHEPWLAKLLEETNACDLLDGITGEYSLFARLRLRDDEHFSRLLKRMDDAVSKSFFKKYHVVNAIRIFKESGTPLKTNFNVFDLDKVDLKLLDVLLNQIEYVKSPTTMTTVTLSRLLRRFGVKISQPAVFQRLKTLEKNRVIIKNTIRVNWAKLGLKTKVVLRVKVNPNVYDVVAQDFLTPMDEITNLYRTGEEYGLLAIVRVRDIIEFNSFLLKLFDDEDIIDTYTTLVLEERKNLSTFLRQESAP